MTADDQGMTALSHEDAASWKVTAGHRVLVRIGLGLLALAVYLGVLGIVFEIPLAIGSGIGVAIIAVVLSLLAPEPVPPSMITGSRTWVAPATEFDD